MHSIIILFLFWKKQDLKILIFTLNKIINEMTHGLVFATQYQLFIKKKQI